MHITEVSPKTSFSDEHFFLNNPTGRVNGRNSKTISGAVRTMELETIPDGAQARPVQQRPLTRVDDTGYMPFFRTSQLESVPAPLLEAPAFNVMSPVFGRHDITVNDPEFKTPDSKPRLLATIIKTYCKSFRQMFSINTPEIDRSDWVEKVRHRLFSVVQIVLASAAVTGFIVAGVKVFLFILLSGLNAPSRYHVISMMTAEAFLISFMLILFTIPSLTAVLTFPIIAAVTAGIDTYEKLSQSEKSPEEKFLNKYQCMEKQLAFLKELYHKNYHKQSCPGGDCPGSTDSENRADCTTSERIEKAFRRADLWSEEIILSLFTMDRRKVMIDRRKAMDEAILKIEYWLENAKKQKDLICNCVEMDVFNKPVR